MAKSFLMTMKELFQMPGETLAEFSSEYQKLTPEDKEWYYKELVKEGYECTAPTA